MGTLLQGSDSVLLDLKVLNGDMHLNFDKYVNSYTVNVACDVTSLEIEYKIDDDNEIKIINNENFEYGINYVFIELTAFDEKNIYTLEVYRDKEINVLKYENVATIQDSGKAPSNYAYKTCFVCAIIIIILFIIIFIPKRPK